MSGKEINLEKWLSAFFDRVDSKNLSRGQQLFQSNRLFGFQEGGSEVEAMVNGGGGLYKVILYYNEADLMELGLPHPNKILCRCTCQEEAEICEHSVCAVLFWSFQTEKTIRRVVPSNSSPAGVHRMKTDLTLKRLEKAAQSSQGPFDHLLRGYSSDHALDFLMKEVFKAQQKAKGK